MRKERATPREPGDSGEGKAVRVFKLTIGQGSDGHLIQPISFLITQALPDWRILCICVCMCVELASVACRGLVVAKRTSGLDISSMCEHTGFSARACARTRHTHSLKWLLLPYTEGKGNKEKHTRIEGMDVKVMADKNTEI